MKPGDPQNAKMEHKGEQKWTQEHQKGAKTDPNRNPNGAKREAKVDSIQHEINMKDKVAKTIDF